MSHDSFKPQLVQWNFKLSLSSLALKLFVPNAPFLYPLKTERFSDVFGGVEKGCIGKKWVKNLWVYIPNYVSSLINSESLIYQFSEILDNLLL